MLYSVLGGVAAFLVCALLLRIFIPVLRKVKLGQKILEIGPSWHKSKEGTPIMGGLFFSIAITAATVVFSLLSGALPLRTLLVLGFALLCGLIGFVDDYVKLFKKTNRGLSPAQKLILQFLVVAAFFVSLSLAGYASTELQIPFTDIRVDLGVFYYLLMSIVLVYFINGANLTDGIDGLAGSVALVIMVFFTIVSDMLDPATIYICTAAVGALSHSLDTRVKGTPVVVYNPVTYDLRDLVEAEVPLDARAKGVAVYAPSGRRVAAQILSREGDRARILFAADVKAAGQLR